MQGLYGNVAVEVNSKYSVPAEVNGDAVATLDIQRQPTLDRLLGQQTEGLASSGKAMASGHQKNTNSQKLSSSSLEDRVAALEEHMEEIRAVQDVHFRALNQKLNAVLERLKRVG